MPARLTEVPIQPLSPERFRTVLGDRYAEVEDAIDRAGELLSGRVVWHVNSTARGGGVVELLQSLLAYARGAGVDARWLVISGDEDFFAVTKRIHNHLHGSPGDGGALDAAARSTYEQTLAANASELAGRIGSRDVIVLHDPQTAGLVRAVEAAELVLWRCHVGVDEPNDVARDAWDFLRPYIESADAYIFSRREFVWTGLASDRLWISPPAIDAFSPKNQDLEPEAVESILRVAGLLEGAAVGDPRFLRPDGSPGLVGRVAELDQDGPIPGAAAIVCQVSRWDRLKDPLGVMRGLAADLPGRDAHLVLAGPSVAAVADDPEGVEVLANVRGNRAELPSDQRARVHLACLPMEDLEENAAMVNALQRRSDIVVQKSVAEGFGLTVAEAMWKSRPVVASRVGGIQDQIVDGESGILIDDPSDLAAFRDAVVRLLDSPERARAIGEAARERVRDKFLGTAGLLRYLELLERLCA